MVLATPPHILGSNRHWREYLAPKLFAIVDTSSPPSGFSAEDFRMIKLTRLERMGTIQHGLSVSAELTDHVDPLGPYFVSYPCDINILTHFVLQFRLRAMNCEIREQLNHWRYSDKMGKQFPKLRVKYIY
jgi:hypothetical protein